MHLVYQRSLPSFEIACLFTIVSSIWCEQLPNGIGTLFGLAQLILYAVYYKSTKEQIAARKSKGESSLSEVVVNGDDLKKVANGLAASDVRAQ